MMRLPILTAVLAMTACATDPEPTPDREARPDVPASAETKEGTDDEAAADAGTFGVIVGEIPAGTFASADGGTESSAEAQATVYDRVIAVPKDPRAENDAIKAAAKVATGAEVSLMRKLTIRAGEKTYVLLVFAPAAPPRDAEAQRALIDKLQASDAFTHADPDKVMTMKGGSEDG